MVEHHGTHYDFPRLQMSPAPHDPPPILIGGQSELAFKRAARLGDGWVGSGHTPDQVAGVMTRLNELRREAGREREPFDAILVLTAPADVDQLRRFEDAGVTSLVSWPLLFTVGPQSTMDAQASLPRDVRRTTSSRRCNRCASAAESALIEMKPVIVFDA